MINKINSAKRIPLLAIVLLVLLMQSIPVALAEERIIDMRSDFPGIMIEAGDTATFPITIRNLTEWFSVDHRIQYRTALGKAHDWDIRFEAAGQRVHRITIPPRGSRTVNLIVETPADARIGEHHIDVILLDGRIALFVYITETHIGKPGTLMLTTVNRDGHKIRGATVSAYRNGERVSQIMTTVAGLVSMELEEGIYDIKIERAGYKIEWKRDVRIRVGQDTDIGIVVLEFEFFINMRSDFPAKMIEAGDTATFPITIRNRGIIDADHRIEHKVSAKVENWDIRFEARGKNIHRILIPPLEKRTVNLIVETPGDAPVGEHYVEVIFYDGKVTFFVYITETHIGKPGTLMLTTVNRDGHKIRGATVSAYRNGERVSQMMTTVAGLLSMDLEEGIYDIKIERAGYKIRWERDVRIRVGRDTDIGIVVLEFEPFAAEIRVDVPSKIITAGTRPVFAITIENIGRLDDTFRLRIAELPHGWHARYMVRGTAVEVTEVFIRAGKAKNLDLEIVPPHGIGIGNYNFISVIESSVLVYNEPLSLSIRGTIDMHIGFDRLRIEIRGGDTATFAVTVHNRGRGISLTDVHPTVSAPAGWHVEITPRTATSIVPGARKVFNVNVIPPADIVAGEYRLTMTVGSDQIEEEVEFRVIVTERPFIALFGVAILIAVVIGLIVMFKKFRRR